MSRLWNWYSRNRIGVVCKVICSVVGQRLLGLRHAGIIGCVDHHKARLWWIGSVVDVISHNRMCSQLGRCPSLSQRQYEFVSAAMEATIRWHHSRNLLYIDSLKPFYKILTALTSFTYRIALHRCFNVKSVALIHTLQNFSFLSSCLWPQRELGNMWGPSKALQHLYHILGVAQGFSPLHQPLLKILFESASQLCTD